METREVDRLQALHRYAVLDTPSEPAFDRLARLAAYVFRAPIAMINFIDQHRQWSKACIGVDTGTSDRSVSFCTHAVDLNAPFVVEDARLDPRFVNNPFVTGPTQLVFYAGAPVRVSGGAVVGSICVIDHEPRRLEAPDIEALESLAALVSETLEHRLVTRTLLDLALTDELTSAHNRRALERDLWRELALPGNPAFTVMSFDLDGLKTVNDTRGHAAGDTLLTDAADTLRRALRSSDHLYRVGGDEFAALLPGVDAAALTSVISRLEAALSDFAGRHAGAGISYGSATFPDDATTFEALLRIADARMYEVKMTRRRR